MSDFVKGVWVGVVTTMLYVLVVAVVGIIVTGCGHLPPHWCKVEPIPVETVGTAQIRHCDGDTCEAVRGEWTVDDVWMFDMARVLYECGEGE